MELTDADLALWSGALDWWDPPPPQPTAADVVRLRSSTEECAGPLDLACVLNPRTVRTVALELVSAELEQAIAVPGQRLMISMPPQEGKTNLIRYAVIRALQRDPERRNAIASYALDLARTSGRAIRQTIDHFGTGARDPGSHVFLPDRLGIAVAADHASAADWSLNGHQGGLYCVGIDGGLTGRPVDGVLFVDDPVKGRAEADSPIFQTRTQEWWQGVSETRLAPETSVVIVMTRWSELDLVGWLLSGDTADEWRVVNIPALADGKTPDTLNRPVGEWIISARGRTVADWERKRRQVGERTFAALYQGRPAPLEGGMLKRGWWRYDNSPAAYQRPDGTMWAQSMDTVIQSWDMAFKDTTGADYVVGQVWGKRGAEVHLLDQVRDRLDFPATCRAVEALSARWPQASLKLVEDKANGPAVIAQLRHYVSGMVPVNPKDSKAARVSAISPFVEAGNVFLPSPTREPWVAGWIEECVTFPAAAFDDQVDAMTQAITRLLLAGGTTDFMEQLVHHMAS